VEDFKNKGLRAIFGPKRGDWGKLNSEELRDF